MDIGDFENLCKELSQHLVKEITPREAPFFDIIWSVLRQKMFSGGQILSPEEWQFEVSQADVIEGLGLHGGENLQTISIISTLSALITVMISSEHRSKRVLDEFAVKYAAEFNTPQWAIPHIKSLVQKQMHESSAIINPKKVHAKPYLIWETGRSQREGTEEDIKLLREAAIKDKFDIYANDAERGELIILGKRSQLRAGETFAWATLIALLERVGSRWTRQELFERIRPNEVYKRRPHSAYVYQWIRHVKESIKDAVSSTGKPDFEELIDSWFQTEEPNRVNISANLRACLVRRNPAAGS